MKRLTLSKMATRYSATLPELLEEAVEYLRVYGERDTQEGCICCSPWDAPQTTRKYIGKQAHETDCLLVRIRTARGMRA